MLLCPICQTEYQEDKDNYCSTCSWDLTQLSMTVTQIPNEYLLKLRSNLDWAKHNWSKSQSQEYLTQEQLEDIHREKRILKKEIEKLRKQLQRLEIENDKLEIKIQKENSKNNQQQQELKFQQYSSQIKVVAAIDFGTFRSGYSYAFKDDKRVIGRYEWNKQPFQNIKTLTQSLYSKDRKLQAWGYDALYQLAELRQAKNAKDYSFFSAFKMALHENFKRENGDPIVTANNGQEFPIIDLVADYLRELGGLLRNDLKNAASGKLKDNVILLKDNEILWCLTISAIWQDNEKSFMRRAAVKAGLISDSESDQERLLLVLEPEAAAIYCQEKDKEQLQAGQCFMVVDCGDRTVDITITTHIVSSQSGLNELIEVTGGLHGSTYVDKEFRDYLASTLTAQALTRYEEEDPSGWLELMSNWERKKCDFDPSTTNITYFDIPNRLFRILDRDYPEVLEKLANEQDGDDEKVHLTKETMQAMFKPILDSLIEKVKKEFARLDSGECEIMYLVGEFSTSPILRQRIQQEFSNRVKIVMPPQPGAAIVYGAALFGLNLESRRIYK